MKKILVTMLAVSLAVVSTVDAKISRGGRRTSGAVDAKSLAGKAQDANDAKKAGDIDAAVEIAKEMREDIAKDPKAAEYGDLIVQINKKEEEIKRLRSKRDALNVSWFGSWTDSDYKKVSDEIKEVENKRRELQSNARKLIGGKDGIDADTAKIIRYGSLTAAAIALAAGIADWYFEAGYVRGAYEATTGAVGKLKGRVFGEAPAAPRENIYGGIKRGLARMAGTTAEKFPEEQ